VIVDIFGAHAALIDDEVDRALAGTDVPLGVAHAFAHWIPPLTSFCVVFGLASAIVCCFSSCNAPVKEAKAVVFEGTPYEGIPYTDISTPDVRFADGVCSCCNNPKLCLASWCCPAVTVAQLWERVVARGTFWMVFLSLVLAAILIAYLTADCPQPVLECIDGADGAPKCDVVAPSQPPSAACEFGGKLESAAALVTVALVAIARSRVRAHDAIAPSCCPGTFDDICCACCCGPLATSQLLRHISTTQGVGYRFFSTSGESPMAV